MLALDFTTVPVLAAVGTLAVAALAAIWLIPKNQARRWAAAGIKGKELADLENGTRSTLVQIVGGVALILTFSATWMQIADTRRATDRTLRLNQEQEETQRFTGAVSELESHALEQRLGAIYGLDRIGLEDPTTRRTIEQILIAYVRRRDPLVTPPSRSHDRGPGQLRPTGEPNPLQLNPLEPNVVATWCPLRAPTASADTQAALDVIVDLAHSPRMTIDLSHTNLSGIRLPGRDLRMLNLNGAQLEDAHFDLAHLDGVNLEWTCLLRSSFNGASMVRTRLSGAELTDASLPYADLRGADLSGADLSTSALWIADLNGASLPGTLDEAVVFGADLRFRLVRGEQADARGLVFARSDFECTLLPWRPVFSPRCTEEIRHFRETGHFPAALGVSPVAPPRPKNTAHP